MRHAESKRRVLASDSVTKAAHAIGSISTALELADILLEQIPACVTVGRSGGWTFVSRRFANLLGYSPAEIVEVALEDLMHPDDLEETVSVAEMVERGELAWGVVVNRMRNRHTGEYIAMRWEWGPPSSSGYSVAIATPIGVS